MNPLHELLKQIEDASKSECYLTGLFAAFSIPDICAALESETGETTKKQYISWFDKWVAQKYKGKLTGEQCYAWRCGVIHQAKSTHPKLGYSSVVFLKPSAQGITCHNNILGTVLNLDIENFCKDIVDSAKEWWETTKDTPNCQNHSLHLIKAQQKDFSPYIVIDTPILHKPE